MSAVVIVPQDEEEAQRWNAEPLEAIGDQSFAGSDSIAVRGDVASLESLDPASQELAVTMMLDQSRQWLERAKESTTPARDVADFKAFVATVAEAAKQKKLSEDIQLDALEMVRRSEDALGRAVREGQRAGEILVRGEVVNLRNQHGGDRRYATIPKISPDEFFGNAAERTAIYEMADASTEEVELALSVAKDEGNLSRRNVQKTLREVRSSSSELLAEKWFLIEDYAGRGFTSTQIAKTVGMSEKWLRTQAADRGIAFPADKITGSRRIDPLKVIENVVASVEASGSALDLVTFEDVTPEQAEEWGARLEAGLRAIRSLRNSLKEIN